MLQEAERKKDQSTGCDGQSNHGVACTFGIRFPRQFYFRYRSSSAYDAFFQRGPLASSFSAHASRFSNFIRRQLSSSEQQVPRVTPASDPSRGHSLPSASSAIAPTTAAPSSATGTTFVQSIGILSLADDLIS